MMNQKLTMNLRDDADQEPHAEGVRSRTTWRLVREPMDQLAQKADAEIDTDRIHRTGRMRTRTKDIGCPRSKVFSAPAAAVV